MRLPVMVSGTLADASGRTLSGQTVEAFYASVVARRTAVRRASTAPIGAKALLPYLERLAAVAGIPHLGTTPTPGLPNVMGGYDETPEMFAADVGEYMRRGLVNHRGRLLRHHARCTSSNWRRSQGNYAPAPPAAAAARDDA